MCAVSWGSGRSPRRLVRGEQNIVHDIIVYSFFRGDLDYAACGESALPSNPPTRRDKIQKYSVVGSRHEGKTKEI